MRDVGWGQTGGGVFGHVLAQQWRHARAALDNNGSIRVLEKCGFAVVDTGRGFANARGVEIDEVVMRLDV